MGHYLSDAVVLRSYKLGESDRIVIMLDPNRGKIRGVAKGVRKTMSRFGGRLEPYCVVRAQLYEGRNLDTITQVELLVSNEHVRTDWAASTCAATMAEACDKLAQEGERAVTMFLLFRDALAVVNTSPLYPERILDAFLWRLAEAEGVAPTMSHCVACVSHGNSACDAPLVAFDLQAGGQVCARYKPLGATALSPDTLAVLDIYREESWSDIGNVDRDVPKAVPSLIRSYVSLHLSLRLQAWEAVPR